MAASAGRTKVSAQSEKHEIKKSSYYVWFLGAKESKGLRGEEYISPVVRYLIGREKEQAPIKVTLQLSNKGLKIIQNVTGKRVHENYRCQENVKHFIPHHAITCSVRNNDVVSCILLIYNPATACPVHVHSYRCDSEETAEMLQQQLSILIQRPDNQKKFLEIESRLQEKGLLHRNASSAGSSKIGSDGRSLGRESDSGAGSDGASQLAPATDKIASMYDNLAAELREKLGGKQPLLLPPRDYDTMHRSRGNIIGIDTRKSLNPNIVGNIGVIEAGGGQGEDSSGKSSGIGSCEAPSPTPGPTTDFLSQHNLDDDDSSSDDEWAEARQDESMMILQSGWGATDPDKLAMGGPSQPLSSRFFQPRSRSGSSPPVRIEERNLGMKNERSLSPDNSAKDRFKGAKQLFMSLERKKDKERKASASPMRNKSSPLRNAQKIEKILSKELSEIDSKKEEDDERPVDGPTRWSRYEQEQAAADARWPKSDRDTGYVSRYSRDKSRSRDFDESPPSARPNIFVKSGKKSSPDSKLHSKRLNRFLSRETLESDGYDHIEEFEPETVEKQRAKVKRQPSRTSLKLDFLRNNSRDKREEDIAPPHGPEPLGPRHRGFIRREMTELDLKGYMQSKVGQMQPEPSSGLSKKFTSPLWSGPGMLRERALSPNRLHEPSPRYHHQAVTKVLMPEFRSPRGPSVPPDNRYPSLDLRNEKRKSMYEGAGDVLARRQYPEPNTDYRRRSYHELSDIDKIDHHARNFQHSGRKMCPEPIGLPSRASRAHVQQNGYRLIPDQQRYPGLDRDNSRQSHVPQFKNTVYHPNSHVSPAGPRVGPRSFDHPGSRPAMFRHSYAEPVSGAHAVGPHPHNFSRGHPTSGQRVSHVSQGSGHTPHGRFGPLKPY